MKTTVRNIIIIILLAAIVVTFHIVRRNATMRGMESYVADTRSRILSPADVDSLVLLSFPKLLETDIKDLDRRAVETALLAHPYVLDADVSVSTGGKLIVKVTPHEPVVRMFYQNNEFYISQQGTCMPLTTKHYCNTLVGNVIPDEPLLRKPTGLDLTDTANHNQPQSLMKIWKTASFLYNNPKYGYVFDQISIASNGDICLTPKLGDLTIVVGDTSQLDIKFENLWAFLDQGISLVGWDTYSTINLKFKNQVVCTKKQ